MIKQFQFNHIQVNTYVIYDSTQQCVVVDPGMESDSEKEELTDFIEKNGLTPKHILLTHSHIDHIAGVEGLCSRYNLPVTLHPDATGILHQAGIYASVMGFSTGDMKNLPTQNIDDGQIIKFGETEIEALAVPGHAAGSMAYCLHEERAVFTGDAIFCQSIGRTDLPTGNYDQLIESLKTKILTLPDDYLLLPGHGPETTVGDEKKSNPFLNF